MRNAMLGLFLVCGYFAIDWSAKVNAPKPAETAHYEAKGYTQQERDDRLIGFVIATPEEVVIYPHASARPAGSEAP